jgi:uncharacterized protein (DUF983 family)
MNHHDWDDDWEDEEYPDDAEEFGTIECPHCGEEMFEDAPQCPHCGQYLVRETGEFWKDKPLWYIVLALLGIVAVILMLTLP